MTPGRLNYPGLAAALALAGTAGMAQGVRTIPLHADLQFPEGIGYDPAGYIFSASAWDGTVVRTSLRDGRATVLARPGVLLPPPTDLFPRMLGLKIDGAGRLWITGGRTGKIFVLDSRTGKLLKELTVPGTGSLLNDAVVTANAAYVTDTLRPILWRIPIKGTTIGEPEAWIDFGGTPIAYAEGRNLNGIARDVNGSSLVVVQMDKGLLFRIDVATKAITPIDIDGEMVTGGDGLELDGTTLYVVRQPESEVVTVHLAPDLASGKVVSRFRNPALMWPATAVKVGNELLVVNTQFNKRQTRDPVLPFAVSAIPVSMLDGK